MENCAGDWFLIDQEMDKALRFSGYDYRFRIVKGGHCAGFYEYFREAMCFIWKGWPQPVQAGPSARACKTSSFPMKSGNWRPRAAMTPGGRRAMPAARCSSWIARRTRSAASAWTAMSSVFVADAGQAGSLSFGPEGQLYAVSSKREDHGLRPVGQRQPGCRRPSRPVYSRHAQRRPLCHQRGEKPGEPSSVWLVKDGKKTLVDSGLKFATGLAYRPDQWLLSVADGHSKWVYSYQINRDGTLTNKERFFWLHVADWEDDAGAESVCYSKEGRMFVATRWGIQVCADDGPTQVILPMPDRSRVIGVCLGGRDMDTLFAFCGDKIWKRKVKTHALGVLLPGREWAGRRCNASGSHVRALSDERRNRSDRRLAATCPPAAAAPAGDAAASTSRRRGRTCGRM